MNWTAPLKLFSRINFTKTALEIREIRYLELALIALTVSVRDARDETRRLFTTGAREKSS